MVSTPLHSSSEITKPLNNLHAAEPSRDGSIVVIYSKDVGKKISYKRFDAQCCCLEKLSYTFLDGHQRYFCVLNDDLVKSMDAHHPLLQSDLFSLSQQRCIGAIDTDSKCTRVLKRLPNHLITFNGLAMTFWTVFPEPQMVSQLKFDYELESGLCEMDDGTIAVAHCDLFIVSPISMKVQGRFQVSNTPVDNLTEIRKDVAVVTSPKARVISCSTVRVVNFQQNRCLLELNHCRRLIRKYAEGMFLIVTMSGCIQGWNDRGECWLYVVNKIYDDSHLVPQGDTIALVTRDRKLNLYELPRERR